MTKIHIKSERDKSLHNRVYHENIGIRMNGIFYCIHKSGITDNGFIRFLIPNPYIVQHINKARISKKRKSVVLKY